MVSCITVVSAVSVVRYKKHGVYCPKLEWPTVSGWRAGFHCSLATEAKMLVIFYIKCQLSLHHVVRSIIVGVRTLAWFKRT